MRILRMYGPPNAPLPFDLNDFVKLLAPRSLSAKWKVSAVDAGYQWFDATGPGGNQLEQILRSEQQVSGRDLAEAAGDTSQVIWGEFAASLPSSPEPWVIIRAIDGTFYEIATADNEVVRQIEEAFDDARFQTSNLKPSSGGAVERLRDSLQALVGLPLCIVRDAADMKVFHFGAIGPRRSGKGTVGTHAFHVQCPWRIVSDDRTLTGSSDRFAPPYQGAEINEEDRQSGNLQRVRIAALLKGYDNSTQSHVNAADDLVVISAASDKCGGADLLFSGGYRLQIFPDSSLEEDWRFIEVGGRHFVVQGGRATIEE